MTFKCDSTRLLARDVKAHLYNAFQDSPHTEQDLGRLLGVTQQLVSQMMHPESERQVPLWILAKLPRPMARMMAARVLRLNGLEVRDVSKVDRPNGSIVDEVHELIVMLGRLAERDKLTAENLPALRKLSAGMKTALDQLDNELDNAEANQ